MVIDHPYKEADLVKWKFNYRVLDHSQQKVAYYMEWRTRKILGKNAAYQVLVWSNPAIPEMRGYSHKVFFDLLFKENDLICTDKQQTPDGQRFWLIVLSAAFQQGLNIYHLDMNKKPHQPIKLKNMNDIDFLESKIWSDKHKGQAILLISKNELPTTVSSSLKYETLNLILKRFL